MNRVPGGRSAGHRTESARQTDCEVASAFRKRASEVFPGRKNQLGMAEDDAVRLWLAWRGDPSFLIANLRKRTEREGSWRVVKYTEIPGLCERYAYLEARCLQQAFPDNVLARLAQFVISEVGHTPGAVVDVKGSEKAVEHGTVEWSFSNVKEGLVVDVRWPSKVAPGLCSRIIVLSSDSILCSRFPALDRTTASNRTLDGGFARFLEKAERKEQKRWARWLTRS